MRIDLPPTHKPPSARRETPAIPLAVHAPQVAILSQLAGGAALEMAEKTPTKLTHREPQAPPTSLCPIRSGCVTEMGQIASTSTTKSTTCEGHLLSLG
ncbi:hypothetical protein DPEC_G00361590 [Dallia pectoralis]|nr:hypothetical protein DPEC_G00361590 [Dallia pectoralis]